MMKIKRLCSLILCCIVVLGICGEGQAVMLRKGKLSDTNYPVNEQPVNRPVLPKTGDIAVVVEGADPHHAAIAEAIIIEELINNGYRVVDEAKMKKIRAAAARAKAARYALEGNVEGILKINGSYNAAATIVADVRAGLPERNEFKLYTGTASAAIIAVTSNGTKLGGRTAQGKAVGYTVSEARENALTSAIKEGMALIF